MILEIMSKYYGVDILAMTLSFIGIYTIGNKQRYGFIIAMIGNMLWFTLGVLTKSIGLLFANFILALLYIRAFIRWDRDK